tara:strand:- start:110 stop:1252 length:1143 start_codon:yes stop_codon:yes gene_type:complete
LPHSLNTLSFSDTLSKLREKVARRGINYSLNRLTASLAQLNHPEATLPSTIHIAGTNGKGSVAHYLTQALLKLNRRVITYTSPHIQCYTERFLVDGQPIQQHEFSDLFDAVSSADRHHQLSEYEILTLMAFQLVQRESPDIFIMETGLGGRLDATNVVPTSMAIITDIGLDHTHILGSTLTDIAKEKAGIIKDHAMVVTHMDHDPHVIEVIKACAKQQSATIHWSPPKPNMHNRNKGLAVIALNELLSIENGDEIMAKITPPFGRLSQSQYQGTPCWMDVGHNLDAAKAIHQTWSHPHPWIVGMTKEKDALPVIKHLIGHSIPVRLCPFKPENSWSIADLPDNIAQQVQVWQIGDAIEPNSLFFGSFYFIESLLKEAHNK